MSSQDYSNCFKMSRRPTSAKFFDANILRSWPRCHNFQDDHCKFLWRNDTEPGI